MKLVILLSSSLTRASFNVGILQQLQDYVAILLEAGPIAVLHWKTHYTCNVNGETVSVKVWRMNHDGEGLCVRGSDAKHCFNIFMAPYEN